MIEAVVWWFRRPPGILRCPYERTIEEQESVQYFHCDRIRWHRGGHIGSGWEKPVEEIYPEAIRAAALAEHEAEVARLRADLDAAQRNQDMLAAVVDYGGQLDQLTDENDRLREIAALFVTTAERANEYFGGEIIAAEHIERARAALSGDTLRSSGEEEANGER